MSDITAYTPEQIQILSELTSRARLATTMGISFNGLRNLYEVLGYPANVMSTDIYNKYKRHDIAKAIIDKPVNKTWKGDVMLLEADDDKETPLEVAWKELYNDLRLKKTFVKADKLTGLNEYGVILLGLSDTSNKEQLALPVTEGLSTLKLNYVRAFGSDKAQINTYDTDPTSERFCKPVLYTIQIEAQLTLTVHYTRVIHIVEDSVDSEIKSCSRLEVVFNRLEDLEKLCGGSAEMFWKGARPGHQGIINPDFTMGATEKDDLKNQLDEYEHNLRRIITLKGIELKELGAQVEDPKSHIESQLQMISAVTNIPQRILIGSERGELASSQDQDEWLSYIAQRRESFIEVEMIRPFVDRLILYKILPEPTKGEYTIEWEDLFAQTELQKIEIGTKRATALKDYVASAEVKAIVPPEAFLELFLGLTPDQITLVNQMRDAYLKEEEKRIAEEEAQQEEEEPEMVPEEEVVEEETEEPVVEE